MIRAPWWTWLVAFGAGAAVVFWWPQGSDDAMDVLRTQALDARQEAEAARAQAIQATATADSAMEAHARTVAASDSTIARLTARVQATTARAALLADSLRATVGQDGAGLLAELEAEWRAALDAERKQAATWQARALSAEAGWSDARLAVAALTEQVDALESAAEAQGAVVRVLERRADRDRRDKRILMAVGLGLLVREAVR